MIHLIIWTVQRQTILFVGQQHQVILMSGREISIKPVLSCHLSKAREVKLLEYSHNSRTQHQIDRKNLKKIMELPRWLTVRNPSF